MESYHWITNKKNNNNKAINLKDNKCFQYTVTAALNHEKIKTKSAKNNINQTLYK